MFLRGSQSPKHIDQEKEGGQEEWAWVMKMGKQGRKKIRAVERKYCSQLKEGWQHTYHKEIQEHEDIHPCNHLLSKHRSGLYNGSDF